MPSGTSGHSPSRNRDSVEIPLSVAATVGVDIRRRAERELLPVDALARVQLARALAASGETARARVAYEDFLTLWKQADTDVPLLKQAKAEAARLRQRCWGSTIDLRSR